MDGLLGTSINWNLQMNKDQWVSTCSDLAFKFDRDRMMCVSLAPVEKRELLLALLAFNHKISIIPELVSETLLGEIRLQWWRDCITSLYQGEKPNHPIALGLSTAIESCELSKSLFDQYLAERSFDLLKTRPATLNDLESYADGTAGALHELMAEVLLFKPNIKIRHAARNSGTAWALTGLLSSIPFHESQGRSYIPFDLNSDSGVAVIARSAERYIKEARSAHQYIPHHLLPVMLPITLAEYALRKLTHCSYNIKDISLEKRGIGRLLKFYWKVLQKRY